MTVAPSVCFACAAGVAPRAPGHGVTRQGRAAPLRAPRARSRVRVRACAPEGGGARVAVGGVVAVRDGRGVRVARVTAVAAGGRTVDVAPLREFVRELYVADEKAARDYARAEDVCEVRAEYVAAQDGWIVLDADVEDAKGRMVDAVGGESVVVVGDLERRELGEDALKRQGVQWPRPSRGQALFGVALSVPVAALFYAGYAGARGGYGAEVAGAERAVLALCAAGCVASLVVGGALLVYALGKKDE